MKVIVVPSDTPFLIANSVFRKVGALIDTQKNIIHFRELQCSVPISLSDRRLYMLDLLEVINRTSDSGTCGRKLEGHSVCQCSHHDPEETLTASETFSKTGVEDLNMRECPQDLNVFQETQIHNSETSGPKSRSERSPTDDSLRDHVPNSHGFHRSGRSLSTTISKLDQEQSTEEIQSMTFEDLQMYKMDFGKAKLGLPFSEVVKDVRYTSWFTETYKDSKNPRHLRLLRFIHLHVERMEANVTLQPKAKAKGKSRPTVPTQVSVTLEDEWNEEEEDPEMWEQIQAFNHGETFNPAMEEMQNRMSQVGNMMQQVLNHLTRMENPSPSV